MELNIKTLALNPSVEKQNVIIRREIVGEYRGNPTNRGLPREGFNYSQQLDKPDIILHKSAGVRVCTALYTRCRCITPVYN